MATMRRQESGSPLRRVFGNQRLRRAMASVARPYRGRIALLGLLITLGALLPLLPPLLYRSVIDRLIGDSSFSDVLILAVGAGVVTVLGVTFTYLYTVQSSQLGRRIISDLQNRMYGRLAAKPIEFFTTVKAGAIGTRITADAYAAEPLFTKVIVGLVANVMALSGAVLILALVDIRLVFVLALIPLLFVPLNATEARIRMLIRRQNGLNTELVTSSEALMNVPGMTLARQAGRLDAEVGRFANSVEDLRGVASRLTASFIRADTIFSFTFGVVTSVVFAIGAWLVTDGGASIGTLVLFLLYIRQVQIPLNALTGLRYDALRAAQAFDRVFEVLDSGPGADDADSSDSAAVQPALDRRAAPGRGLAFDNVRYRYQSIGDLAITSLMNPAPAQGGTYEDDVLESSEMPVVLDGISFQVEPGEWVAVVGSSGVGKSTLSFLGAGLYRPMGGTVYVGGSSTRDLTGNDLARRVALITQDTHVLHETVRNNLRYVNQDASDAQVEAACEAARLASFIESLPDGYDTLVGERGYRFSGGQRQRLALARALLKPSEVVIMDEPTSQVDPETEALITEATRKLFGDRAVLTITHNLQTTVNADRILVLEDGHIVESGPHDSLVDNPSGRYAAMFRSQSIGS